MEKSRRVTYISAQCNIEIYKYLQNNRVPAPALYHTQHTAHLMLHTPQSRPPLATPSSHLYAQILRVRALSQQPPRLVHGRDRRGEAVAAVGAGGDEGGDIRHASLSEVLPDHHFVVRRVLEEGNDLKLLARELNALL